MLIMMSSTPLLRQLLSEDRSVMKEPRVLLGRWNVSKCLKQEERVVYYANMDHCGDCGKLVMGNKNIRK